jgi:hypothetical protein
MLPFLEVFFARDLDKFEGIDYLRRCWFDVLLKFPLGPAVAAQDHSDFLSLYALCSPCLCVGSYKIGGDAP